jgi:hypothetical protein
MLLALVHAAFAGDDSACALPLDRIAYGGATAGAGPLLGAAMVNVRGCYIEAAYPGPDTLSRRDQLWTEYEAWLGALGFAPSRREHHEPWNEVRWQRFERDGASVELQIRRPDHADSWAVMVVPKASRSLW